jgi:mono/diheme cytochrome c family protein
MATPNPAMLAVPALAALVTIAASACANDPGDHRIGEGETVYVRECSRCHMLDGSGVAGVYPNLRDNPIVVLESPEPMTEIVTEGREAMPAFGTQIPEQEVAAVISYVRQAWGNDASPVTPAQVK